MELNAADYTASTLARLLRWLGRIGMMRGQGYIRAASLQAPKQVQKTQGGRCCSPSVQKLPSRTLAYDTSTHQRLTSDKGSSIHRMASRHASSSISLTQLGPAFVA